MEEIRKFVDEMITLAGVTGDFVPMLRHILLTITAILLAMLSDFLCRKILVPLISKITDKTDITWDDVLLNKKVLTSACHIVLKDDFAQPDGIRILGFAPRQIPTILTKPMDNDSRKTIHKIQCSK